MYLDKRTAGLLSMSKEDAKVIESIITNKDKLMDFKGYIYEGYDIRNISNMTGLTIKQVEEIKYILGKI